MAIEIIDSEISDGDEGINAPESADIIMKRSKIHRNKKNLVIREAKEKPRMKRKYKYVLSAIVLLLLAYLIFFRSWGLTGVNLGIFSLGPVGGSANNSETVASTTPQLNYSIIAPSRFEGDGFYHTDFQLAISYPQGTNLPQLSLEQKVLTCASPIYGLSTSSIGVSEIMTFGQDCTSKIPVEDDHALFLLSSTTPTTEAPGLYLSGTTFKESHPEIYGSYTDIVVGSGTSLTVTGATVSSSITDCGTVKPFVQAQGSESVTLTGNKYNGACPQQILDSSGTKSVVVSDNMANTAGGGQATFGNNSPIVNNGNANISNGNNSWVSDLIIAIIAGLIIAIATFFINRWLKKKYPKK